MISSNTSPIPHFRIASFREQVARLLRKCDARFYKFVKLQNVLFAPLLLSSCGNGEPDIDKILSGKRSHYPILTEIEIDNASDVGSNRIVAYFTWENKLERMVCINTNVIPDSVRKLDWFEVVKSDTKQKLEFFGKLQTAPDSVEAPNFVAILPGAKLSTYYPMGESFGYLPGTHEYEFEFQLFVHFCNDIEIQVSNSNYDGKWYEELAKKSILFTTGKVLFTYAK